MRKTAISVPARLLAEIDRAAKKRGESRSKFIQRLFAEAVRAQSDAEFVEGLNAFFAEKANSKAHRREAETWSRLTPAWSTEGW